MRRVVCTSYIAIDPLRATEDSAIGEGDGDRKVAVASSRRLQSNGLEKQGIGALSCEAPRIRYVRRRGTAAANVPLNVIG
jgi:hypothetical protein